MTFNTLIALILVISFGFIAIYSVPIKNRHRISRWKSKLQLDKHAPIFESIFSEVNGFQLSQISKQNCNAIDYIYGEIEFLPFISLLSLVKPNTDTVFYDLGSGTGKAVIACAMVFPIKRAVGIELFPLLHEASWDRTAKLEVIDGYQCIQDKISFIQGNFLDINISDATLVFINASTLIGNSWNSLIKRLESTSSINTVITTTKPLKSGVFTMVNATCVEMSWGVVNAYIHHRP
ncbi:methyltransferase [Legionella waltersii]|uniref:methyltransferase n=1 Tax=Legionella waltersii TaxID=66969 RepID=UPI000A805A2C|nr:methyltransferase [Legionella waltersii]